MHFKQNKFSIAFVMSQIRLCRKYGLYFEMRPALKRNEFYSNKITINFSTIVISPRIAFVPTKT